MDSSHHSVMSSLDSSPRLAPQRMSNLYQYHNAPEVAPAHGLEYDDNTYPSSDKYPVVHTYNAQARSKSALDKSNRPPLIIFGMKIRTFLVVAAILAIVIIGAAVGGAVGGKNLGGASTMYQVSSNSTSGSAQTVDTASSSPSTTASPTSSTTTTFNAATPTYNPLSDCPQSNSTEYTSTYARGTSGTPPAGAGLNFTKYCDYNSPLSSSSIIAEAFVYSFSDCVELCAGYNFWNDDRNCTVAVYNYQGSRPGNCWIGFANITGVESLAIAATTSTAVAILQ